MINIFILILTILFITICFYVISEGHIIRFIKNNKLYSILLFIILLSVFLIRMLYLDKYPIGLNQDEASSAYEAYSIMEYGIDRNGMSYPVHFISWGSGQNVLYSYLTIPFIYLFGLNTISIRLPMAITGCISIIFITYLFNNIIKDDKKKLIAIFIFSIIPWHIMKSRWSLESNIFPDIVLWATILLYFGVNYKKTKYLILSSILYGISLYSYGTSYLFIPIYLLLLYIYLIKKKEISIKKSILLYLLVALIGLPMILFVIINYFQLDTIKVFNITIPRLYVNRFTEITSVNGNFIYNFIINLGKSFLIIFTQADNYNTNYIYYFGIFYLFSLPLIIIGIYKSIKDKRLYITINKIWLISSIILLGFTEPFVNRINYIWFPLIFFIIYGTLNIIKNKIMKYFILGLFSISFILFSIYYFTEYQETIKDINHTGYLESLEYVKDKEYNYLYIDNSINMPYIYYIYSNKINPNYYINNRTILEEYNTMFQNVYNINNVYFYIPSSLYENNIYIINKNNISNIPNYCNKKQFNNYYVIEC